MSILKALQQSFEAREEQVTFWISDSVDAWKSLFGKEATATNRTAMPVETVANAMAMVATTMSKVVMLAIARATAIEKAASAVKEYYHAQAVRLAYPQVPPPTTSIGSILQLT